MQGIFWPIQIRSRGQNIAKLYTVWPTMHYISAANMTLLSQRGHLICLPIQQVAGRQKYWARACMIVFAYKGVGSTYQNNVSKTSQNLNCILPNYNLILPNDVDYQEQLIIAAFGWCAMSEVGCLVLLLLPVDAARARSAGHITQQQQLRSSKISLGRQCTRSFLGPCQTGGQKRNYLSSPPRQHLLLQQGQ